MFAGTSDKSELPTSAVASITGDESIVFVMFPPQPSANVGSTTETAKFDIVYGV